MTCRRRSTLCASAAGLLALGVIAGCGSGAADDGSPPTATTSATSTPTAGTVTAEPPTTEPSTTEPSTTGPKLDLPPTTPPGAKDAPAIPRAAQDYGTAFVTAWVGGDRARATQLGTESAVKAAFASRVEAMPRFVRCEGAAGSSYCTWAGDEYTLQVRLGNELASRGEPHAVTEVVFQH